MSSFIQGLNPGSGSDTKRSVVFNLDVSDSMGIDFLSVKLAVADVFAVMKEGNLVTTGTEAKIECEGCSNEELYQATMSLRFGGATDFLSSLQLTQEIFDRQCGDDTCEKIMVLISDFSDKKASRIFAVAEEMEKSGIRVYVLTTRHDHKMLSKIATNHETALIFESFEEMSKSVKNEVKHFPSLFTEKKTIIDIDVKVLSSEIENHLGCEIKVTHISGPTLLPQVFRIVDTFSYFNPYSFMVVVPLNQDKRKEFKVKDKKCLSITRKQSMIQKIATFPKFLDIMQRKTDENVIIRTNRMFFDPPKFPEALFSHFSYLEFEALLDMDRPITILTLGALGSGKTSDLRDFARFCGVKNEVALKFFPPAPTMEISMSDFSNYSKLCASIRVVDTFGTSKLSDDALDALMGGRVAVGTKREEYSRLTGSFSSVSGMKRHYDVDVIWWYIELEDLYDGNTLDEVIAKYEVMRSISKCVSIMPVITCKDTVLCSKDRIHKIREMMHWKMHPLDRIHIRSGYPDIHDKFPRKVEGDETLGRVVRSHHYFQRFAMLMHKDQISRQSGYCKEFPHHKPMYRAFAYTAYLFFMCMLPVLYMFYHGFALGKRWQDDDKLDTELTKEQRDDYQYEEESIVFQYSEELVEYPTRGTAEKEKEKDE